MYHVALGDLYLACVCPFCSLLFVLIVFFCLRQLQAATHVTNTEEKTQARKAVADFLELLRAEFRDNKNDYMIHSVVLLGVDALRRLLHDANRYVFCPVKLSSCSVPMHSFAPPFTACLKVTHHQLETILSQLGLHPWLAVPALALQGSLADLSLQVDTSVT